MSWSVNQKGNPQDIVDALNKQSESLTGQSKVEFDCALPHLVGLLEQNYSVNSIPVISLTASGHGNGEDQRQCFVEIKTSV